MNNQHLVQLVHLAFSAKQNWDRSKQKADRQACKRKQKLCLSLLQTMLHKPMPLTVPRVYKTLRQIAMEKGSGAAGRRQQAVLAMLRCCRSARFCSFEMSVMCWRILLKSG